MNRRTAVHVRNPGMLTTVQDLGRFSYAHLGISPAGAADQLSFRIANLLVGNKENVPALEMTLVGATLEFEESAIVAITGAACDCTMGAHSMPLNTAIEIPAGGVLKCGSITNGVRCYVAIAGGFDVPLVMGSASTHLAGQFGGFEGRRLKKGDVLTTGACLTGPARSLKPGALDAMTRRGVIRVTRGAQCDWFSPDAFGTFFASAYSVTQQSDRSGLRLSGQPINPRSEKQLLTDGIPLGAVQVPQNGQPIILFVDQQTTGGYPKIANVITADLHRVGQLRPGEQIRFEEVSMALASRLLHEQEEMLKNIFEL